MLDGPPSPSSDDILDDWLAIKSDAFAVKSEDGMCRSSALPPDDESGVDQHDGGVNDSSPFSIFVSEGPTASQITLLLVEALQTDDDCLSEGSEECREISEKRLQEVCTFGQFEERHTAISAIFPTVESLLPNLPREPSGFWSFFTTIQVDDATYRNIEVYLRVILSVCGASVLKEIFFAVEENGGEEYVEELSELHRQHLQDVVRADQEVLDGVYPLHDQVSEMKDLILWHELEEKALEDLEKSERRLYEFSCRPFVSLQEMASVGRDRVLQRSLDNDLSLAARAEAACEEEALTQDMIESRLSLLDLESGRYQSLAHRTQRSIEVMLADKDRFCHSTAMQRQWVADGAASRLHLLERRFVTYSVDLLRVRCRQLQVQKEEMLLNIASLSGDIDEVKEAVHQQEKLFYQLHIHLLDTHLALLDEREKQIKFWLEDVPPSDTKRRQQLLAKEASLSTRKSRRRVEKVSEMTVLCLVFFRCCARCTINNQS